MKSLVAFAAAMAIAAGEVCAQASDGSPWMKDAELRSAFSGQSIAGRYPSGQKFTEEFQSDGQVAYKDDVRTYAGQWSVNSGTFCTIYDDDPGGGCFLVRRTSSNCFEFYFVSRPEARLRRPGEHDWTAQAWLSDRAPTCVEGSEV